MPGEDLLPARTLSLLRRAVISHATLRASPWAGSLSGGDDRTPSMPSMELSWSFHNRDIRALWDRAKINLPAVAHDIIEIFEQALLDAQFFQDSFSGRIRSASLWRGSIEDHAQNNGRRIEDVLIDGLRDASLEVSASEQDALFSRWRDPSKPAIFRRLALYLLSKRTDASMTEKLAPILQPDVLFELDLKHEVFTLIEIVGREGTTDDIVELISAIDSRAFEPEPDSDLERTRRIFDREIFDRLDWLAQSSDSLQAKSAFDAMRASHPQMGQREHANFDMWSSSGVWGGVSPMPLETFIDEARVDVASALTAIVKDYPENDFNEPSWEDALRLVEDAVATAPDLGSNALAWSSATGDPRSPQVADRVFRGWERAKSSTSFNWIPALKWIGRYADDPTTAVSRLRLLTQFADVSTGLRPRGSKKLAYAAAQDTWSALAKSYQPAYEDPAMDSLNSWPGQVGAFWIHEALAQHRAGQLTTLPVREIRKLIRSQTLAGRSVAWLTMSNFTNFWIMDRKFASGPLARLISSTGTELTPEELNAWDGLLHQNRSVPNEFATDEFFLNLLNLRTSQRFKSNSDLNEALRFTIAAALLREELDAATKDKLVDTFVVNDDAEGLAAVLRAVGSFLRDADPQGEIAATWYPWLTEVLQRRISGIPRRLTAWEASAWNDVALYSGNALPSLLADLKGFAAPFTGDSWSNPLEKAAPGTENDIASALLANVIQRVGYGRLSDVDFWNLAELVPDLFQHVDQSEREALVNAVVTAGRADAIAC